MNRPRKVACLRRGKPVHLQQRPPGPGLSDLKETGGQGGRAHISDPRDS